MVTSGVVGRDTLCATKAAALVLELSGSMTVTGVSTVRVAAAVSGVIARSVVGEARLVASTSDSGVDVVLVRSSLGSKTDSSGLSDKERDDDVPNMPAMLGS